MSFLSVGMVAQFVFVSRDGDKVSFLSMGTMAQCRYCQFGWRHSAVSISRDVGRVSSLSMRVVTQCRLCQ